MRTCKNNLLQNFPYLEDDFDALTDYELFSKMTKRVNEIYKMFKDGIDQDVKDYINAHFNDIVLNALYDENEEKLVLYLEDDNNG